MHKLVFFVPEAYLEPVKNAVFTTGAGRLGDYEHCAWQSLGQGQFRPMKGSDPFIGDIGELERVDEYRVEMVCADELVEAALAALKRAHPYEEPAFDLWRLADI